MTLDHAIDTAVTPAEMERLKSFDSSLYGQLDLYNSPEGEAKRQLLLKGAQCLENELIRCNKLNTTVSPNLICSLGHLQLLLEDFPKALSAYQKYYNSDPNYWQNTAFLYGFGIVYCHYSQDAWAVQAFQMLLYREANFSRASDVHLRLGIIKKKNKDYEAATKHFKQVLNDSNSSAFLKAEVRFHGAHMYELEGDLKKARSLYEQLLQGANIPNQVRANAYKQLGWMYHMDESMGDLPHRQTAAIEHLKKSLEADNSNGESWYYLGRCYSTLGKVHDAFVSYRQSIDKSEASADTWCSIGILYQQQSQPMDALQAYICAVQLDKAHTAAWTNLGLLYEANSQLKDALHCFQNAVNTNPKEVNPNVKSRISLLQNSFNKLTPQQLEEVTAAQHQLPCIDKAFHLPIPAELTSRQQGGVVGGAPPQGYNACPDGLSSTSSQMINGQSPRKRKALAKKKADAKQDMPGYMNAGRGTPYMHPTQGNMDPQAMLHRHPYYGQQPYAMSKADNCMDTQESNMERMMQPKDDPAVVLPPSETLSIKQEVITAAYPVPPSPSVARQSMKSRLNLAMSAQEILDSTKGCQSREMVKGSPNILSDMCRPPLPAPPPEPALGPEHLTPATPTITIECKKDAMSSDLKRVAMAQPIVLVKSLTNVLRLNLGLFSTKTLVETAPDHPCEVRTQRKYNVEETLDAHGNQTWKQESTRTSTTIAKYAQYQASSFQESLAEETGRSTTKAATQQPKGSSSQGQQQSKPTGRDSDSDSSSSSSSTKRKLPPMIRFGTNVDLSDRDKWKTQLVELQKLPHWLRVHWSGNALSHLGHTVLGMNSVQLYMKIPGCRTPAHQENLNLCSINFNIGPGDCEWFAVPDDYWGALHQLCVKNNVDYLSGAWWPLPEDLIKAKIPLYRFTQKPGDLVFIAPGTVHWVQATGWCNNIAWNTAPMDTNVLKLALERYEFNKLQNYKSIVPMIHLSWKLASNVKMTNPDLLSLVKFACMKSLEHTGQVEEFLAGKNKHIVWHGRQDGEPPHYCFSCELEVFNILFVREVEKKHVVYCLDCALKISSALDGFVVLRENLTDQLAQKYDSIELHLQSNATEVVNSILSFNTRESNSQSRDQTSAQT
ncbi:histone demethylase UTY-like [Watersipora subatra]|uniref:histone demethylase UTY-like n=1 Tax=Watersipora subatra TaxID=2589382 RepID=UPI00355B1783